MAQVRTEVVVGTEASEIERTGGIVLPSVSVEVALYAVLLVAAGLLRLYALGRQPLESGEAEVAWSVWRFYRGQADAGVAYAPLLFFGSVLAFLIFEAGDTAARLVPAIFGVLLVALPYFYRRWLGRWGALATSALLVVSPSVVFFSRSLSSAIPSVTTALAFLAVLLGYLETRETHHREWRPNRLPADESTLAYAAAVALALSLTAGPAIYTVLLAMAVFAAIVAVINRWGLDRSASETATGESAGGSVGDQPEQVARSETGHSGGHSAGGSVGDRPQRRARSETGHSGDEQSAIRNPQSATRNPQSARLPGVARDPQSTIHHPQSARALGLFAVTLILVSTGFLADYRGLQASLELFADWLSDFAPGGGLGSLYVIQALLSYELLALVFGVIGGVYLTWRRNPFASFLAVWSGLALLLYSAAGAKAPEDVLVVLLPLIFLAGMSIGRLLEAVAQGVRAATMEIEGFLVFLILVIAGVLYLQLVGYALRGQPGFVRLSLGAVVLLVVLLAIFVYWSGREATLRGGGLAMLLLLGALSCHASFNLNLRWLDAPAELLRPRFTSADVRHLVGVLERLSNDRERHRYSIGITADANLAPILPWYLRSFEQVRFVDPIRDQPGTPVVIVPVEVNPPLPEGYIGQRFRLETSWQFSAASWRDRWRWYLFRLAPAESQARDVVLYVGR